MRLQYFDFLIKNEFKLLYKTDFVIMVMQTNYHVEKSS